MLIRDLEHLESLSESPDPLGGATPSSVLGLTFTGNLLSLTLGDSVLFSTYLPTFPTGFRFSLNQGQNLYFAITSTGTIGTLVNLVSSTAVR